MLNFWLEHQGYHRVLHGWVWRLLTCARHWGIHYRGHTWVANSRPEGGRECDGYGRLATQLPPRDGNSRLHECTTGFTSCRKRKKAMTE
jgi:hypothetical protein